MRYRSVPTHVTSPVCLQDDIVWGNGKGKGKGKGNLPAHGPPAAFLILGKFVILFPVPWCPVTVPKVRLVVSRRRFIGLLINEIEWNESFLAWSSNWTDVVMESQILQIQPQSLPLPLQPTSILHWHSHPLCSVSSWKGQTAKSTCPHTSLTPGQRVSIRCWCSNFIRDRISIDFLRLSYPIPLNLEPRINYFDSVECLINILGTGRWCIPWDFCKHLQNSPNISSFINF